MKRRALTAADLPLSHSFHVKTVLYIVVIVTSCIVLPAIHAAIAAVVVRVGVIATTLAGKSKSTLDSNNEAGDSMGHLLHFIWQGFSQVTQ